MTRDPDPFELFNPDGRAPVLVVCDHAGVARPASMGDMGLSPTVFDTHIAQDIGAADVTRKLAERLDAPAVLAPYTRLLIDVNRPPGDPESVPVVSDGVSIPVNKNLSEAELVEREERYHWPYHHTVANALAHLWRMGTTPALFSIHSFTPVMNGAVREWDAGVLWNRDPRMAQPLIHILRERGDIHVGDNQPYSGKELAYTIDNHGGAAGLPHAAVEIRQDHLEAPGGAARWAEILDQALERVLAIEDLHRVEHF